MKKQAFVGILALILTAGAVPFDMVHAQYGGGGVPVISTPTTGNSGGGGRSGQSRRSTDVPSPAPAASGGEVLGASSYNFTETLSFGSDGEAVTELQKILIDNGYLKISVPTGWFGPLTRQAVKAYQVANGIEAVGIVGPITRAKLNEGTSPIKQEVSVIEKAIGAVANAVRSAIAWSAST